jgi:hypothetical protein
MSDAATAPLAGGRHQRRLRNYLLDSHFQLKYSAYLVLIAIAISACLGIFLWRTSREVLAQSHKAVEQGEQVVARGREVVSESQKVSAVVHGRAAGGRGVEQMARRTAASSADAAST